MRLAVNVASGVRSTLRRWRRRVAALCEFALDFYSENSQPIRDWPDQSEPGAGRL